MNAGNEIATLPANLNEVRASDIQFEDFVKVVGNRQASRAVMTDWCALVERLPQMRQDEFFPAGGYTNAEFKKRLELARKHASGLAPLLDERAANQIALSALNDPDSIGLPEMQKYLTAVRCEVEKLSQTLVRLVANLEAAKKTVRVRAGAPVQWTRRRVITEALVDLLISKGVPKSHGDGSKMVRAVRKCWEVASFEGDPRDMLMTFSSLNAEKTRGANFQ